MENSAKKVIMISGANRGIGRSITEKLLSENYRLSLGVRNPEQLPETLASAAETDFSVRNMMPETMIQLKPGSMLL